MVGSPDNGRDPMEALAEDFLRNYRNGKPISVEEYADRHPRWKTQIFDVFPTLILLEETKPAQQTHSSADLFDTLLHRNIKKLGEYLIVRKIAQGGMGVVYEAVQQSLGRRVALKILSPAHLTSRRTIQRFRREAHAAANLHHTNIVPVFGVGQQWELHYYIMQFIDGRGLDDILATTPPGVAPHGNWNRIADMGRQIASALQYAHGQETLHRDVKPANLLVDRHETVWITDFGLAKVAEQDDITAPGEAIGTLRYMAPEQLNGVVDARTDIYGLGITLYELLTWRPAYREKDRTRLLRQIAIEPPIAPRRIDPCIPRDLETIVLKAIARDPSDRFETAGEMAEDLGRFLNNVPVRASRTSIPEKWWRWSKRNPAIARLSGVAVVLSLLVALIATLGYVNTTGSLYRESAQKTRALVERHRADMERERAEENLRLALATFDEIANETTHDSPLATTHTRSGGPLAEESYALPASSEMAAVLQRLLHFYEEFSKQNGDHPEIHGQLIRANRRIGHIRLQLGQHDEAQMAYRRAIGLCDASLTIPEASNENSIRMAALWNDIGIAYLSMGRSSDALSAVDRAIHQLDRCVEIDPEGNSARYELARSYKTKGDLAHVQGDIRRWGHCTANAVEILQDLVQSNPENTEYRFLLAISYGNMPPFSPSAKEQRPANKSNLEAIRLLTELADETPNVARYQFELSRTYAHVHLWRPGRGDTLRLRSKNELRAAKQRLQKALVICRKLCQSYPSVPDYRHALAQNLGKLAQAHDGLGKTNEAEEAYRKAIDRQIALRKRSRQVPRYSDTVATLRLSFGKFLCRQQRFLEAIPVLEDSLTDRQEFLKTAPNHPRATKQLAQQLEALAQALSEVGERDKATEVSKKAAVQFAVAYGRGRPLQAGAGQDGG